METYKKSEGRITPDDFANTSWAQKQALCWQPPNVMSMGQFMEMLRKRGQENSNEYGNAAGTGG